MLLIQDNALQQRTHDTLVNDVPHILDERKAHLVKYNNEVEFKNALDLKHIPKGRVLSAYNVLEARCQEMLENLLQVGVFTDPNGRGCGIHHLPREGFLDLHHDGNWHPELEMLRVASMVYYVSGDTSSEFFHDELRIAFVPNRMVLFSTEGVRGPVLHGVPKPVREDRYTLSAFFYITGPKPKQPRRAYFPFARPSFTQERTPLK